MGLLLVLLFIVVPLAELAVIIEVGSTIGVFNTIGLLIAFSVLGGWLMKHEGMGVLRRMQATLSAGGVPGSEIIDGFLILFGGALMLTPGFLTDVLGLALLLPPVRIVVRRVLRRRFTAQVMTTNDVIDL